MSLAPLDVVSACPWHRVTFTTYALSLSFFEAVLLDALVRSRGDSQPLILADVNGVRESLSEQGAHRVGKDYDLEPVVVRGGIFHAKVTVLTSSDECHVLVGSGNLTFNGWGSNCEVIEHLHPGFAADALGDVAEFFELLPRADRVTQGAGDQCLRIASDVRHAIQGKPRNGALRFLHNLETSIAQQIAQAAADLGGAQRLTVAAPFWDSGAALDNLCRALGVQEAFLHAHAGGTVQGTVGANWPQQAHTTVHAVRAAPLDDLDERERRLHAKVFEVLCRRGRLVVSGSANGTRAALDLGGNVEACVLRVQHGRAVGWTASPADLPVPHAAIEADDDTESGKCGVLRAVLEREEVIGRVLTPPMRGTVEVYHLAAIGPELLATTELDADGGFRFAAPDLEKSSWRGGRLVIRVVRPDGDRADGFVSVASYAEIARRGGTVTRRLLAVMFGSETPEDVTAILDWFLEDPKRLSPVPNMVRGEREARVDDAEQLIPVAALQGQWAQGPGSPPADAGEQRHWSRFLDQVLAAFRSPRRPFDATGADVSEDEEDDGAGSDRREPRGQDDVVAAYASFIKLFDLLTKDGSSGRHCEVAFDLTGFICARLRPDLALAREWLERIVHVWLADGVPPERREDVAAAILAVLGTASDDGRCRWARDSLQRLGVDLSAPRPATAAIHNYQVVLPEEETADVLWAKLQAIRTFAEERRAYLLALEHGQPAPADYADLEKAVPEAWPVLSQAFHSASARASLLVTDVVTDACPIHHISLPMQEVYRLESIGIAVAKNCCRRVIIRREN